MWQVFAMQLRFLSRRFFVNTAVAWLLLATVSTMAAEAPTVSEGFVTVADAEQLASRAAVVQELLEIQERLGGSIVTDREPLQGYQPATKVVQAEATDYLEAKDLASGPVESLRDAAWQLTLSAKKLEQIELYKQADAMRKLAQQLRLDARAIRAQSGN